MTARRRPGRWRLRDPRSPDAALRGVLGAEGPVGLGDVVGVEHEYRLIVGGSQVAFRPSLDALALGQRRLEPTDPNARSTASGSVVTCDGAEAEIAIPPVPVAPGFSTAAAGAAADDAARLAGSLDAPGALLGYSTHCSVATPPAVAERVADLFASRFAVPMMLLYDRATSPGLLVRPRPGRTELGGEYVCDRHLADALVFAVGAVRWCVRRAGGDPGVPDVPAIEATVVADPERYGWYVDRRAVGTDLYAHGRRAGLRTGAGTRSAQDILAGAWDAVRPEVSGDVSAAELDGVDAVVSGARPLPLEDADPAPIACGGDPGGLSGPHPDLAPVRRRRSGIELAPVLVTWETVVFVVVDRHRRHACFVTVPRPLLASFGRRLRSGTLDRVLSARLRRPDGSILAERSQTLVPGFFDALGRRADLVASERDPSDHAPFVAV